MVVVMVEYWSDKNEINKEIKDISHLEHISLLK